MSMEESLLDLVSDYLDNQDTFSVFPTQQLSLTEERFLFSHVKQRIEALTDTVIQLHKLDPSRATNSNEVIEQLRAELKGSNSRYEELNNTLQHMYMVLSAGNPDPLAALGKEIGSLKNIQKSILEEAKLKENEFKEKIEELKESHEANIEQLHFQMDTVKSDLEKSKSLYEKEILKLKAVIDSNVPKLSHYEQLLSEVKFGNSLAKDLAGFFKSNRFSDFLLSLKTDAVEWTTVKQWVGTDGLVPLLMQQYQGLLGEKSTCLDEIATLKKSQSLFAVSAANELETVTNELRSHIASLNATINATELDLHLARAKLKDTVFENERNMERLETEKFDMIKSLKEDMESTSGMFEKTIKEQDFTVHELTNRIDELTRSLNASVERNKVDSESLAKSKQYIFERDRESYEKDIVAIASGKKIAALQDTLSNLETSYSVLQNDNKNLNLELKSRLEELDSLKLDFNAQVQSLKENLRQMEESKLSSVALLEGRLTKLESEKTDLHEKLSASISQLRDEVAKKLREISDNKVQYEDQVAALVSAHTHALSSAFLSSEESLANLQQDHSREKMILVTKHQADLEALVAEYSSKVSSLNLHITNLEASQLDAIKLQSELKANISELQGLYDRTEKSLQKEVIERKMVEENYENLNHTFSQNKVTFDSQMRKVLDDHSSSCSAYEDEIRNLNRNLKAIKSELENEITAAADNSDNFHKKEKILISKVESVESSLEAALSNVAQLELQNRNLLDLKNSFEEDLKVKNNVISSLKVELRSLTESYEAAILESENVKSEKTVLVAMHQRKSSTLEELHSSLNSTLEECQASLFHVKASCAEYKLKYEDMEKKFNDLWLSFEDKSRSLVALQQSYAILTESHDLLKIDHDSKLNQITVLQGDLKHLTEELASEKESHESVRAEKRIIADRHAKSSVDNSELESKLNELETNFSEKVSSLEAEVRNKEESISQLQVRVQQLELDLVSVNSEKDFLNAQFVELQTKSSSDMVNFQQELQKTIAENQKIISDLNTSLDAKSTAVSVLDTKLMTAGLKIAQLTSENIQLHKEAENKLSKISSEFARIGKIKEKEIENLKRGSPMILSPVKEFTTDDKSNDDKVTPIKMGTLISPIAQRKNESIDLSNANQTDELFKKVLVLTTAKSELESLLVEREAVISDLGAKLASISDDRFDIGASKTKLDEKTRLLLEIQTEKVKLESLLSEKDSVISEYESKVRSLSKLEEEKNKLELVLQQNQSLIEELEARVVDFEANNQKLSNLVRELESRSTILPNCSDNTVPDLVAAKSILPFSISPLADINSPVSDVRNDFNVDFAFSFDSGAALTDSHNSKIKELESQISSIQSALHRLLSVFSSSLPPPYPSVNAPTTPNVSGVPTEDINDILMAYLLAPLPSWCEPVALSYNKESNAIAQKSQLELNEAKSEEKCVDFEDYSNQTPVKPVGVDISFSVSSVSSSPLESAEKSSWPSKGLETVLELDTSGLLSAQALSQLLVIVAESRGGTLSQLKSLNETDISASKLIETLADKIATCFHWKEACYAYIKSLQAENLLLCGEISSLETNIDLLRTNSTSKAQLAIPVKHHRRHSSLFAIRSEVNPSSAVANTNFFENFSITRGDRTVSFTGYDSDSVSTGARDDLHPASSHAGFSKSSPPPVRISDAMFNANADQKPLFG